MRDFDCRAARGVIAVEGKQAIAPESVNDVFHHITVAQGQQLRLQNAAARVFLALAQRDQAQEHLPRHVLARLIKALVDFFGALRQSPQRAADVLISGAGQQRAFAAFEEFSQGVLQQRQGAGLFTDVINDGFYQPLFQYRADA